MKWDSKMQEIAKRNRFDFAGRNVIDDFGVDHQVIPGTHPGVRQEHRGGDLPVSLGSPFSAFWQTVVNHLVKDVHLWSPELD